MTAPMGFAPVFAAPGDWGQFIVPILALAVWIISALAKNLGNPVQQPQANRQDPNELGRPARAENRPVASAKELEEFLRNYSGPSTSTAQRKPEPRRKPQAPAKQPQPAVARPVAQRHLHSGLETRHANVVHSKLESKHLEHLQSQIEVRDAPKVVTTERRRSLSRRQRAIAGMLRPRSVSQTMIVGQVLQAPPGLHSPTQFDPFGPVSR